MAAPQLFSVCNNTKWEELREAMLELRGREHPVWRSTNLNGVQYGYDGEWYYHFRDDGDYSDMQYVDVKSPSDVCDSLVQQAIQNIGLVATRLEPRVWRIYGYIDSTTLAEIQTPRP